MIHAAPPVGPAPPPAAAPPVGGITRTGVEPNFTGIASIFTYLSNLVLGVGIALTIIYTILAGIKYMSSQGDPKALQAASGSLKGAVIGFIILISALAIKVIISTLIGANPNAGVNGVTPNF